MENFCKIFMHFGKSWKNFTAQWKKVTASYDNHNWSLMRPAGDGPFLRYFGSPTLAYLFLFKVVFSTVSQMQVLNICSEQISR